MPRREDGNETTVPGVEAALTSERIVATLRDFQVEVSESLAMGIANYVRLLLRWNRKVSLTTVTAPQQILARHVGESLFGARVAGIEAGRLLDVGSGAGFPALPIAMIASGIRGTLLEPNVKKAAFLAEACRELALVSRIRVVRARLEDYVAPEAEFDFVTSRAVRVTAGFLKRCAGMIGEGGRLVLWVGEEDLVGLKRNRGWAWAEPVRIPGSARRYIVWGVPVRGGTGVSRETLV